MTAKHSSFYYPHNMQGDGDNGDKIALFECDESYPQLYSYFVRLWVKTILLKFVMGLIFGFLKIFHFSKSLIR